MTELLGRERELATAFEVIAGTASESAVAIDGAAGIGKTRVLDSIVEEARQRGFVVLVTRPAEAESDIGLLGFRDLLDQVGQDALRALPDLERERLEVALGHRSMPPGRELDEGQLALALHALLRSGSRRGPLVLAIDDLQWLDASTSALLQMALRRLDDRAVRLVATRRTGVPTRFDLARTYRDRLRILRLDGLSLGALQALLSSRLGRTVPRPALIRLHALTEGNPLYALELARAAAEGTRSEEAFLAGVAPNVSALLGDRVGRLSATARDVVAIVAAATRPDLESIARTLELPRDEIERAAEGAVEAGLLAERPWGYGLAHPLVGAASNAIVSRVRQRDLHRRLAAVLEDAEQVAVHRALATVGRDEAVAAALEQAADRVAARGATIDAADLFDRAIRLTPPDEDAAILRRRMALARALLLAGDTHGALTEFDRIGLDRIPDPTVRAEAILLLGVVQRYVGKHAEAIAAHEQALEWEIAPGTRARLHLRLAWHIEHDLPSALRHAHAALELIDPESAPLDYAFASLARARLELSLGIRADHESVRQAHALQGATIGRGWDVSTIPIDWAVWMEDWAGARELVRRAAEAAEESGDETSLGHVLRREVEIETWSGSLEHAERLAESALARAESSQQRMSLASSLARRGLIHALRGRLDQAERDGEAALSLAAAHHVPPIVVYALTTLAHAARLRDDHGRVDELLRRAAAELEASGDVDHSAYRFHGDHLDALVALGELDRARELVARLEQRGALGPRPTWTGVAQRGRALIALAEGRVHDAAEHARRAIEIHAAGAIPLEAARSRMVAAEADRRAGRRKAAAAHLREGLAAVEASGADGWVSRIRRDLERLAPDHHELGALTPAEERIAAFAADGIRNREIATRLAISEKTVEAALGRAYSKLGIRSRAQLSAALARSARGDLPGTA